jgi:uncharacterized membrane protein
MPSPARIITRTRRSQQPDIILMPTADTPGWFTWAVRSACFAALTAIFAKMGREGIDSDFATLVRTAVILFVLAGFVFYAGKWSNPFELRPRTVFLREWPGIFLVGAGVVVLALKR